MFNDKCDCKHWITNNCVVSLNSHWSHTKYSFHKPWTMKDNPQNQNQFKVTMEATNQPNPIGNDINVNLPLS